MPHGHLVQIVGYGVVTAAAFGLTFAALARIGATHTAVVMTLEAASTVVLAGIALGEGISLVQALGGLSILTAAGLVALRVVGQPVEPLGKQSLFGVAKRQILLALQGLSQRHGAARQV